MKVSGFTFLRNGQRLGYPFVASIRSILPIVDEFVIALGPCDDDTEKMVRAIGDPKIRIIPTQWNERLRSDYSVKGFVFGQQKSIALFNCTGDWAFYLEADEVLHESDLPKIRAAMEKHLDDERVEALAFDYLHFYGNKNTIAWSPGWYRSEVRIIRNTIPAWSSESLFFNVVVGHKKSRYPRAAHTGATIYHYGWVRSETQMHLKASAVHKYWDDKPAAKSDYTKIDPATLKLFTRKLCKTGCPKRKESFKLIRITS
jgi:glycosyltransferase involved in cell wall biosynthesis